MQLNPKLECGSALMPRPECRAVAKAACVRVQMQGWRGKAVNDYGAPKELDKKVDA